MAPSKVGDALDDAEVAARVLRERVEGLSAEFERLRRVAALARADDQGVTLWRGFALTVKDVDQAARAIDVGLLVTRLRVLAAAVRDEGGQRLSGGVP